MAVPVQDGSIATATCLTGSHLSVSVSHTINAGLTDSLLLILATGQVENADSAGWGSVLMKHGRWTTGGYPMDAFWLLNPTSGTQTAGVTWHASSPGLAMACITFTGVSGVYFDPTYTATDADTDVSLDFLTYGVDSLGVSVCESQDTTGHSHSQGAGQTETSDINAFFDASGFPGARVSTSYKTAATVGTNTTMSTTTSYVSNTLITIGALILTSTVRSTIPQEMII